jgi:hypothetical protein
VTYDSQLLVKAIRRDLGEPNTWADVHTYPNSMAECVIDALWSERVRYSVIEEIIQRYRSYRTGEGGNADTDSAQDLLATFAIGVEAWMDKIGNRQRVFSRDEAPYKAEVVREGAQAAVDSQVSTTDALRRGHSRDSAALSDFKSRWLLLPSQHSGLTWERLLLLAGVTQVPADGWVAEYILREGGFDPGQALAPTEVEPILEAAAKALSTSPMRVRNAIWRFETKRDRASGHGPKGSHASRAGAIADEA